ncbi:chaplin [Streptomyces sp. NPDC002764]|uniref:chaplin n=1 Tax=Streptomyces sp. NPDC002764 TaxID=3154428 RepID=UPI003324EFE1
MRYATRNGVIALAVASGAMAVAGPAYADSAADGSATDSPGLISGNTIQLPAHVPVNACGNTVNVAGLLNPAAGNTCTNQPAETARSAAPVGATASGDEHHSPGVVSGNGVQLPLHLPVNASGNSVNAVGIGNPVFGNHSTNTSPDHPAPPTTITTPSGVKPPAQDAPAVPAEPPTKPEPPRAVGSAPQQHVSATLAHTGSDGTLAMVAASTGLLLGGAALYRRSRAGKAQ